MKYFLSIIFVFLTVSLFSQTNCFTIAVGKEISETGNVLVAHNEDDWGDLIVNMYKIPKIKQKNKWIKLSTGAKVKQVKYTNEMIWFETTKEKFGDFYMNQNGVSICSNACQSKEDKAEGKIGYDLRRIVAERAENARNGVEIAIELVEKFGYETSGRTYCIADAEEVWLLALVQGKHYVAQKVPDDGVAILPNFYTIEEIDMDDKENFITSPDLIDYAIDRGWWDETIEQPFNFRLAYGKKETLRADWNTYRNSKGRLAFDKTNKNIFNTSFSIKPSKKVSIEDLKDVLENHFIKVDELDTLKTPHDDNRHPICNRATKFSVIVEFNNTNPDENTIWFAPTHPCINPYVPIIFSIDSFPRMYQTMNWQEARKTHFEENNNFENYPEHASVIFNIRNNFLNARYAAESQKAIRVKEHFEDYAKTKFEENKTGQTSYDLLFELYGNIKNFRH